MQMSLPGLHNTSNGDDDENLPEWVSIFQRYWEYKKSHPSKSAQEEQKREIRRTMQRTILPPVQPLGDKVNEVVNETSSSKGKHKSSNSLIVESGKMIVLPTKQSTLTTPMPTNSRCVSSSAQCSAHNQLQSSNFATARPELSEIAEFMKQNNENLFRRSYKEILEDLDAMKLRLDNARANNDFDAIEMYNSLYKKLVSELKHV